MTDYTSMDAVDEMLTLGLSLLHKVDRDARKKKAIEVAKVYVLVRRESERVENEARRLKLEGKLDPKVYAYLSEGYCSLSEYILEMAKSENLEGDVKILSRSMKGYADRKWSSLAEYVKSEVMR